MGFLYRLPSPSISRPNCNSKAIIIEIGLSLIKIKVVQFFWLIIEATIWPGSGTHR